MAFFKTVKRKFSLRSRGSGISARAIYSSGGQAIPIDGFFGIDGIPIGIEGRREDYKEKRRRTKGISMKNFFYSHYICVLYVAGASIIGACWQGWI